MRQDRAIRIGESAGTSGERMRGGGVRFAGLAIDGNYNRSLAGVANQTSAFLVRIVFM